VLESLANVLHMQGNTVPFKAAQLISLALIGGTCIEAHKEAKVVATVEALLERVVGPIEALLERIVGLEESKARDYNE
jgi:hypothetical protein